MIEYIGWLGSFCFAICGAPEAYRSYKNKRCDVGWGLLNLWLLGEIFTLVYVILKSGFMGFLPLLFNYTANLVFLSIMFFYKISYSRSRAAEVVQK
jgi:uncharacterized protein with PQ loop repeat